MTDCRGCGKTFKPVTSQRYCGEPCIAPSAQQRGSYARMDEPVKCRRCGGEFLRVTPTQAYCSVRCRRDRVVDEKPCRTCGKPFKAVAGQAYCGNPCLSPSIERTRAKGPQKKTCHRCAREFTAISGTAKYCSDECRSAPVDTKRFKLNPNFEYKDSTWSKHVRAVCGNVCADCGKNAEEAGPLHAHHIVPRARGGKNVISNGMLLCQPCHTVRHDPSLASDDLVERIAQRVVELLAA